MANELAAAGRIKEVDHSREGKNPLTCEGNKEQRENLKKSKGRLT